jgi:hypothetical protein
MVLLERTNGPFDLATLGIALTVLTLGWARYAQTLGCGYRVVVNVLHAAPLH